MSITQHWRRLTLVLLTCASLLGLSGAMVVMPGTIAPVYAQVSAEFQAALEPYGEWRRHARWGEVWVPDERPGGWRPYSIGHWVYTDDWGWFWVSDDDEADWGWVTYHYGRWIFERGIGWFWVPGDEWGPAWVDWRRGDAYVGWAPLPPDDVLYEYEDDPTYWVFVEPRYVAAPRLRSYYLPPQRTAFALRSSVVVNRSFRSHAGTRIAVNPGISPAVIAAASRSAVPTFRVRPRVLSGTQGVAGAVAVRPQDLGRRGGPGAPRVAPIAVQRTTTLIQPAASVPKPRPLRKDEPGRLGSHPPRAAQGGTPQPPKPAGATSPPPGQSAPASQTGPRPLSGPTPPPPAPSGTVQPSPPSVSGRQGPPPAQAKPVRPLAPQTPPPPPGQFGGPRPPPPTVAHPPPPPRPVAPAPPPPQIARPPAPPPAFHPPPPAPPRQAAPPPQPKQPPPKQPPKPGEKKPEVPR